MACDITLLNGDELISGRYILSCNLSYRQTSPANPQECFNLCYTQLQKIVEQIISVIKHHFQSLIVPPEFSMNIQACLPPAWYCIHNIIQTFDDDALKNLEDNAVSPLQQDEPEGIYGTLTNGVSTSRD